METLTLGRGGPALARPSTAGWIYWGKLIHVSGDKLHVWTGEPGVTPLGGQRQGQQEYYALRQAGALQTIVEHYNTRAAGHADASTLAARLAAGPVEQAGAPTPMFANLARRLAAAGIRAALEGGRLSFSFAPPMGETLHLAQPIAHPWLPERSIDTIGALPELPEYAALIEANARAARLSSSQAPATLAQQARASLEERARKLFDAMLGPEQLRFEQRTLFSARAVAAPGPELPIDRVGLAEEIGWALFGPQLARELGDPAAVHARDARANSGARCLDGTFLGDHPPHALGGAAGVPGLPPAAHPRARSSACRCWPAS